MRVAVVAGPDPGHSFPAIALCQRFRDAGDEPTLFTGEEWIQAARDAGIEALALDGLAATDEDLDAGARIHRRAARMARAHSRSSPAESNPARLISAA